MMESKFQFDFAHPCYSSGTLSIVLMITYLLAIVYYSMPLPWEVFPLVSLADKLGEEFLSFGFQVPEEYCLFGTSFLVTFIPKPEIV
jgi:hypothetical protein